MPASFKNILCIRADNMGDLLMSSPAIRALKETFNSRITLLTSPMAAGLAPYLKEIDEVISYDIPWVKAAYSADKNQFFSIVSELKSRNFDAAVIFTVYSQNPLPGAMLAYLADIPVRAAYCRENPYQLLTHWVPDEEPYTFIRHQVKRDLDLAASLGASTQDEKIRMEITDEHWPALQDKLSSLGINVKKPWLLLHPGVSEKKREYPPELWVETAKQLSGDFQLLFTGGKSEKKLTDYLQRRAGVNTFSLGGALSLQEFILLIKKARLVISVNTASIHLAAAFQTPQIVLYALSNPQHLPWKAPGKAFFFKVPRSLKSRNEVVRFVNKHCFSVSAPMPQPDEITAAAYQILNGNRDFFPELAVF